MPPQDCTYVGAGAGTYSIDPAEAVKRGRRRELTRTLALAAGLLLAELPMRLVATGDLKPEFLFPTVVSGRLSLVLDTLLVVAYLLLSYRANGLLHAFRAPSRTVTANYVGMALVGMGAALDLTENALLWWRLGAAGRRGTRTVAGLSPAVLVLVLTGLVLQSLTLLSQRKDSDSRIREAVAQPDAPEAAGTVICCSGGGIRSSAFSLGGLQALTTAGIYQQAAAVVGVSGGGYVAAAYHVLRWQPGDRAEPVPGASSSEWPGMPDRPAFELGSPELAWVRRHTRYLVDSLKVATQGALSLAFGIGVNLLLMTVALGGVAWMLSWLLLASGRIRPWPVADHQGLGRAHAEATLAGHFTDGSAWQLVGWAWLVPAAGLALFMAVKMLDKMVPGALRIQGTLGRLSTRLLVGGGIGVVLLLGVPWALESLTAFAASSGSAAAGLVHQLGLVPTQVCNDVLRTGQSACGVQGADSVATTSSAAVSAVSFATVVSSILAVMASAKSAVGAKEDAGWLGRWLSRAWARVKDPVVPWGAAVLIVAMIALALLRAVARFVADPALFAHWQVIYLFAGLLVAAKVFTEPNRTSLHHFFRERISKAFLVRRNAGGVEPVPYRRPLRFSEAAPRDGGPELVACAIANVSDQELVPSRRGCTPFVFDHERIGLTDPLLPPGAAQRGSAGYEFAADRFYRDATVPAAVAISAAAFSPLAGRENVRLGPYRAVLALGNARLGVWLPNPLWLDETRLAYRLMRLGKWAEAAALADAIGDDEARALRPHDRAALDQVRRARSLLDADAAVAAAIADGGEDRALAALVAAGKALGAPPATLHDARSSLHAAVRALPRAGWYGRMWQVAEYWRNIAKKPGLSKLVKEAVGKPSVHDRFLYVTDGGHYDNLGLIEALRRRPRRVFVLDASNDAEDSFRTLGRAIATARIDLGLEIELDPRGMRRIADGRSPAAWCAGTYRETGDPEGRVRGGIYLVKAIMLDGLPWDIETYSGENTEFPRTSTGRQLYSEFDFEAYRMLGQVTAEAMLAATGKGTTSGAPALGEVTGASTASGPRAVEPAEDAA